jgi:hypothetical protein
MRSFGVIHAAARGGLIVKKSMLRLSDLELLLRFCFHLHEPGSIG